MNNDYKISGGDWICIIAIGLLIGWGFGLQQKYNKTKDELIHYKNIVENANNSIKRDSIVYNIQYKDSTIVRIKKEYRNEIEYVKSLDDSESVVMFNKLVWSD